MKQLTIVLGLYSFFLLCACTEQAQVGEIPQNGCQKYIELYYSNYDSLKTDPLTIIEVKIEGDCLQLTLQYSGGCKQHQVDLALILIKPGTPPYSLPTFEIRHDSNGDSCEALITKDYRFDISGIREQGKTSRDFILNFRNSAGEVTGTTYTYSY